MGDERMQVHALYDDPVCRQSLLVYHQSMEPILSQREAAVLDSCLIKRHSLSESSLIDNAARLAYEKTKEFLSGRILFLIGPGNNGADGLAMAMLADHDGFDVSVLYLYEKGSVENMRRRGLLPCSVHIAPSAAGYDTVVDALFGFGFHGALDERAGSVISEIDGSAVVISLDVPSAFSIDADITVMMTTGKLGVYHPSFRGKAGTLFLVNPGFPDDDISSCRPSAYLLSDDDSRIRRIKFTDYKNSKGHLCVIGGSDRYQGAVRLSARAAFASGAGLVSVITRASSIRDESPSIMIADGTDLSLYDAFVAGPGWDDGDGSLLDRAISTGRNIVIDADGLKFVPSHKFSHRAVITPHIGEYRRLMKALSLPDGLDSEESLAGSLRLLSAATETTVVLKSSVIWVTSGKDIYIYDGVNPSMGIAGSGDVLSGIIGALLAEGESPERAALDGVILHQKAGKAASRRYGYYPAELLIEEVGRAR